MMGRPEGTANAFKNDSTSVCSFLKMFMEKLLTLPDQTSKKNVLEDLWVLMTVRDTKSQVQISYQYISKILLGIDPDALPLL